MAKEERDLVVPLRRGFLATARWKRAKKAVTVLREFLERHLKAEVRIGQHLNEFVWARGMKNPPPKVKVHATIEEIDGKRVANVALAGKKFTEAVRPEEKIEEEGGLKGKLQQALGTDKKKDKGEEEAAAEKESERPAPKTEEKEPKAAPAKKESKPAPKKSE